MLRWHLITIFQLPKVGTDQPIGGPRVQKVEGAAPLAPIVVAPMQICRPIQVFEGVSLLLGLLGYSFLGTFLNVNM